MGLPFVNPAIELSTPFTSKEILPNLARGAGTTRILVASRGNSILSTLNVTEVVGAATVTVSYYDHTTGLEVQSGTPEKSLLNTHTILSAADAQADKILVNNGHNKVFVEIVVTGAGTIAFGLYGTSITSFAASTDSALYLEGETFNPVIDKAIGIGGINPGSPDTWKFFRIDDDGNLCVKSVAGVAGTPFFAETDTVSDKGVEQTLIDVTVPGGTTRQLTKAKVCFAGGGSYKVTADGAIIGSGRLILDEPNHVFDWEPFRRLPAGTVLRLLFTQDDYGPDAQDVEAYLMGSDLT